MDTRTYRVEKKNAWDLLDINSIAKKKIEKKYI